MINLADIAGAGAVVAITFSTPVKWVRFTAIGSGTARVGAAGTVSSTVGEPLVATTGGVSLLMPVAGDRMARFKPTEFAVYVPTGCTLTVAAKEG